MRDQSTLAVPTPVGLAECLVRRPEGRARAILFLGHGAGGDVEAPDLVALSRFAVEAAIAVVRVRQPYRVAGRRGAAPAAQLDVAWSAAVAAVRVSRLIPGAGSLPVAVGGRSSGARVACRTASEVGARAVLALAFPLHPPGRPDRTRAAELEVAASLLVVQGSRDAFGVRSDFPAGVEVVTAEGADHGLKGAAVAAALLEATRWLVGALGVGPGIDVGTPAL